MSVSTLPTETTSAATPFAALTLRPALRRVLAEMHITTPTPIQAQAIPPLLEGRDVIGQARTGSGKTLAFGLPLVERCDPATRGVQALVLVPTRELAIQVGEVVGRLAAARGLRLTLVYGGRSYGPQRSALASAQIVVGTPGRTLDHLRQGSLSLAGVRVLVLDEADEMLDRGFAPDVERILAHTPRERQTALFSATMPAWVAATANKHLRNPQTVAVEAVTGGQPAPAIEHLVYDVTQDAKLNALRTLLDERDEAPIIVFGRTKHGVKKLARQLGEQGYPVAALQGNLSQNARERVMSDFRSGAVQILLATNVAARGLDVQGIGRVINYELPESAELFTHRVGRTGRMGRSGEAITLLTPDDAAKWREIEKKLGHRLPRRAWPHAVGAASRQPAEARRETPLVAAPATHQREPVRAPVRTGGWPQAGAGARAPHAGTTPPRFRRRSRRPGPLSRP